MKCVLVKAVDIGEENSLGNGSDVAVKYVQHVWMCSVCKNKRSFLSEVHSVDVGGKIVEDEERLQIIVSFTSLLFAS